jgi:prepilin-type N-terminal cleavage/methylation domain-containing protein
VKTEPTRPAGRRDARAGFTLIEVLIALVILSVGLLGLEALGIGAARMVNLAQRESEWAALGTQYLEGALADLREGDAAAAEGLNTDVDARQTDVRVTVVQTQLSVDTGQERVDVTVTVIPEDRGWIGPQDSVRMVGSVIR